MRWDPITLLARITPALNGAIFRDMALKRLTLHVCLSDFDRKQLKNTAHQHRRRRCRR